MIPEHKFVNCAVCGSRNYVEGLSSCFIGHRDDLDLRSPLPYFLLIQHCRNCGYSAANISDGSPELANLLKKPEYINCENTVFPPERWQIEFNEEDDIKTDSKAKSYYQCGLLMLWTGKIESAYNMFMCAAWMCDDEQLTDEMAMFEHSKAAGHFKTPELEEYFRKKAEKATEIQKVCNETAKICRRRATDLFDEVMKSLEDKASKKYLWRLVAMQVDALRRSESFEEAIQFAEQYTEDLSLKPLAEYQINLCQKHDSCVHTQNEVYDYFIEHTKEFEAFYEKHKDEYEELKKEWEE